MHRLIGQSPEIEGQIFELTGPSIEVGRAPDCALSIAHPSVSGHHGVFEFADGDYKIRDLGSTNGTRVNDERITETVLRNQDTLMLGNLLFVYESDNVVAAPPLPDANRAIEIGSLANSGRPTSFKNFAPFPKPDRYKIRIPALFWISLALALTGIAAFIFRLMTVSLT